MHPSRRLYEGSTEVEVEWTVGPIPVEDGLGKEVTLWYASPDIDSGRTFFTDANGRLAVRRERDGRPTWRLNVTEPVAGNFYPVTASAFVRDSTHQLAVTVDRAQGRLPSLWGGGEGGGRGSIPPAPRDAWRARVLLLRLGRRRCSRPSAERPTHLPSLPSPAAAASLEPGSLEFLVHRRLLADDGRGVDEPLNETSCDDVRRERETACGGLVVRGRHWLEVSRVHPAKSSSPAAVGQADRARRWRQQLHNDPPVLLFGAGQRLGAGEPGAAGDSPGSLAAPAGSLSLSHGARLPRNVQLLTLARRGPGRVLVRLAHSFQVGEGGDAARPVTLDLHALFSRLDYSKARLLCACVCASGGRGGSCAGMTTPGSQLKGRWAVPFRAACVRGLQGAQHRNLGAHTLLVHTSAFESPAQTHTPPPPLLRTNAMAWQVRELTLSANQHAHAAHKRLVFPTGDDIGAAAIVEPLAECDDGDDAVQACTAKPLHVKLHPLEVGLEPGIRGLRRRELGSPPASHCLEPARHKGGDARVLVELHRRACACSRLWNLGTHELCPPRIPLSHQLKPLCPSLPPRTTGPDV